MYNNATSSFRIPYMAQGERSSGMAERRAARIIDNQLTGMSRMLGGTGILAEGSYASTFTSGASTIQLDGTSENYAFEGYIAGVYITQAASLTWAGLPDNSTIYLYVALQESNLYESTEVSSLANRVCVTAWNTSGLTPANAVLVGIAITTGTAISLSTLVSVSDSTFPSRPVIRPYASTNTIVWQEVTSAAQQMAANTGYVNTHSGVTVFSLPLVAPVGSVNEIVSPAPGFWEIRCTGTQSITVQSGLATTMSGLVASINRDTSARFVCTTTNTNWSVTNFSAPLVVG